MIAFPVDGLARGIILRDLHEDLAIYVMIFTIGNDRGTISSALRPVKSLAGTASIMRRWPYWSRAAASSGSSPSTLPSATTLRPSM